MTPASVSTDGQFYRCQCPSCSVTFYDALPPKLCEQCGSADLVVTFDHRKRAAHLAKSVPNTRTADQVERQGDNEVTP